jgi:RNA polymerase sigma-70 factor (ECF subfamily)
MLSDEQLMLMFQKGDSPAFEELFDRYRNSIYGFFRRRLSDVSTAEELTQETFIVILRGTQRYEPKAQFRTYLYAIAFKLLWSERRRAVRERRAGIELSQESVLESGQGETFWIRDALSKLDADHREVLMLREYEQLSYDEIAALLDIPINTVRSRLFRARTELKALVESQTAREASR